MRIIYGGSANSKNVNELLSITSVDGLLVGGASLKTDFINMVNVCNKVWFIAIIFSTLLKNINFSLMNIRKGLRNIFYEFWTSKTEKLCDNFYLKLFPIFIWKITIMDPLKVPQFKFRRKKIMYWSLLFHNPRYLLRRNVWHCYLFLDQWKLLQAHHPLWPWWKGMWSRSSRSPFYLFWSSQRRCIFMDILDIVENNLSEVVSEGEELSAWLCSKFSF